MKSFEKKWCKTKTSIAVFISFLSLLFLLEGCTKDETPVAPVSSNIGEKLQTLLAREYDAYIAKYPGFPGGVAVQVLYKNETAFAYKGFSAEITNRYHLRAQSITKSFTAAGIMLLYQRGQLDIHDYITDNIPNSTEPYLPNNSNYNVPYKNQIRIWDLLTHRAGVFDPINDDRTYVDSLLNVDPNHSFTLDEIVGCATSYQISYFPPNGGWHYSNAGYVMLVKVIERVSGKSYKQFINDEFVLPLGLTDTNFPDSGTETTLPSPYIDSWAWSTALTINLTEQNMTYDIGEGNMISSVKDLGTFFKNLLTGSAGVNLKNVSNYMMDCKNVSDVGLMAFGGGLMYLNNLGYGHGGDGAGMSVRAFYDPQNDFQIIAYTNCYNYKDGQENGTYYAEQTDWFYQLLYKVKQEIFY